MLIHMSVTCLKSDIKLWWLEMLPQMLFSPGSRCALFTEFIISFSPASLPSSVDITLKTDIQNSRSFVNVVLLLLQQKS